MSDDVIIRIKNWKRYKGREDVKLNSWFRCSNRLLEDPDFFDFTHSELMVWIYILSQSSQKNSAEIKVNFNHAFRVCRLEKSVVVSAIEKLKDNQLFTIVTLRVRDVHDTRTCATLQDRTIQDSTIQIHTVPNSSESDSPELKLIADSHEPLRPKSKPRFKFSSPDDLRQRIAKYVLVSWDSLYSSEYIHREFSKMILWLNANPKKNNKSMTGWTTFISGWLERGWERHLRTVPNKSIAASNGIVEE